MAPSSSLLRVSALALLGCVSTASAAIASTTWTCSFKGVGKDPYIPSSVTLVIDEAKLTGTVYDALIAAKHAGPIGAKISRRDGKSWTILWEVEVPFSRNRTSQADYRVILTHTTGRASMRADVPGNIEPSMGKGQCRRAN
ncbi:hypothetical protein [Ruegeria marina]|uniref:Uncharacterized protein n=1 Tax=Ruegeria marina TaxID=639004 RepID=A0A1G6QMA2_9RHOB|nr:hypothetical protein [Ruegeria marina]SDC93433.1 hypothetical protein SAMN04488239_104170 [Ruegeria marina]